mgnify:CR=1 FL=1
MNFDFEKFDFGLLRILSVLCEFFDFNVVIRKKFSFFTKNIQICQFSGIRSDTQFYKILYFWYMIYGIYDTGIVVFARFPNYLFFFWVKSQSRVLCDVRTYRHLMGSYLAN